MTCLLVELHSDRNRCGLLTLLDDAQRVISGPFPVAARATDRLAAANGNPARDPLLCYGDTPCGDYVVRRLIETGDSGSFSVAEYGPHGMISAEPVAGDAACAEANGRFQMTIIAGDLAASGQLRSTAGALRLSNQDQRALMAALPPRSAVRCRVVERADLGNWGTVFVDDACAQEDPAELLTAEQMAPPSATGHGWLRAGAAGALAFGATVTFVTLPSATPAHADAVTEASATASHGAVGGARSLYEHARLPGQAADPADRYITLAYGY